MTVLLVDSDLGFVFWLGQMLDRAGCAAFPAKSASNAVEFIEEEKIPVDIVVIDPLIAEAVSFVSRLQRIPSPPKIIASVIGSPDEWRPLPGFDSVHQKPHRFTHQAALEWIAVIHRAAMNLPGGPERLAVAQPG